MGPEIITQTTVETKKTVADFVKVPGENYYAFKATSSVTGNDGKPHTEETFQSFAKVPVLVDGAPVALNYDMKQFGCLVYLRGEALEQMRLFGFCGKQNDDMLNKWLREDMATPFDNIASCKPGYQLVYLGSWHQHVKNSSGDYLPVGVQCDYISAAMHNTAYNLPEAVEILKKRSDILFLSENGSPIEDIPHYNRDSGRKQCIHFMWQPSAEDYRAVMKRTLAQGFLNIGLFRAMFDIDVLGLRAGGASKHESFYGWAKAE